MMTRPDRSESGGPTLGLRPVGPDDHETLVGIYASTRADELALVPWSSAEKDAFVRQQFDLQDHHYRLHFPASHFDVILADGAPVGRLSVHHGQEVVTILDIALLPAARGRGIGTRLLTEVLAEADHRSLPARLHVDLDGRARPLYERLGFRVVGDDGVRASMERPCAISQA